MPGQRFGDLLPGPPVVDVGAQLCEPVGHDGRRDAFLGGGDDGEDVVQYVVPHGVPVQGGAGGVAGQGARLFAGSAGPGGDPVGGRCVDVVGQDDLRVVGLADEVADAFVG